MSINDRLEALRTWHADNERDYRDGKVDAARFLQTREWLRAKMERLMAGDDR
jgi:hypothetical protein